MNPGRLRSLLFFVLLFAVAALALDASYGQGRGSGDAQQKQQGQMQKDMHQKGHMTQQQKHVREHMPDHGMYGHEMMTVEERERFRQQLDNARSDREWSQLRAEHQREMQARARAQGRQLDPPVFGQHMMTMEEQKRYSDRMQAAKNDEERVRIRQEHQQKMMERASELGIGEMLADQ